MGDRMISGLFRLEAAAMLLVFALVIFALFKFGLH